MADPNDLSGLDEAPASPAAPAPPPADDLSGPVPGQQIIDTSPRTDPPPRCQLRTDPTVCAIVGPQGGGKTSDAVAAAPNGAYGANKGALDPVPDLFGFNPSKRRFDLPTIAAFERFIREASEKDSGYDALVGDDASVWLKQTFAHYAATAPTGRNGKPDSFYAYNMTERDLVNAMKCAMASRLFVILTLWDRDPDLEKGLPGGLLVPSAAVGKLLTGLCSLVVHVEPDPGAIGRHKWKYRCVRSEHYAAMKQRYPILPDVLPPNLGEILRFCGFSLSRHRQLPWQEAEVETIALRMWHGGGTTGAREALTAMLERKIKPAIAQWTVRDALARVQLWRTARVLTYDSVCDNLGL